MPLAPGTQLGPYQIGAPLGVGGMGEVYLAKDTRLGRDVAIKVLAANLAQDSAARQRFDREARAISSLNHPNICTLYDVGHQGGIDFLVMEHLEGETLASRLAKGPLPSDLVLKYGIELCEGLETAHRAGVVHRDLKPGNVMLTKTGAKLMDFGLAKAGPGAVPTSSLTLTAAPTVQGEPLTVEGAIVGTFLFMSPEQMEGKVADVRSDIFALGAVIYEMATGRHAFEGRTTASVIAAVLEREPPSISSVQPLSPPGLDRVINTCLAKDPEERFQSAHDLKLQLKWIAEGTVSALSAAAAAPASAKRKKLERLGWLVASVLALFFVALAVWSLRGHPASQPAPVFAYIPPPASTRYLAFGFGAGPVAVSPDGKKLIFTAIDHEGVIKLWLRPLDAREATAIAGTEDASNPFWSPDGRSIGFFAESRLKTLNLESGNIQVLSDVFPFEGPASWGSDGTIILSNTPGLPMLRIPAVGGKASPVGALKPEDYSIGQPAFLPDGKHFLYSVLDKAYHTRIEMAALDSAETKLVLDHASRPRYAAGFLLFISDEKLFARPFDPASGKLSGTATPLLDASNFSVEGESILAFQASTRERRLQWFDFEGKPLGSVGQVAEYLSPKLSPDGARVLTAIAGARDSSVFDLWSLPDSGGVSTRLTFGPGLKAWCLWSPDGKYIAYAGTGNGRTIYRKAADGSGVPEPLFELGPDFPRAWTVDWSPDGRYISYSAYNVKDARWENWILPLFGDKKPFQAARADADMFDGNFSPDGHWLAYFSSESGRPEVYVVPFPGPGGKYQISTSGGWLVRWSKKNQLFFLSRGNQLMEADLNLSGQALRVESLRPLFPLDVVDVAAPLFDVSSDGRRFLAVSPAHREANSIGLLLNWSSAASRK